MAAATTKTPRPTTSVGDGARHRELAGQPRRAVWVSGIYFRIAERRTAASHSVVDGMDRVPTSSNIAICSHDFFFVTEKPAVQPRSHSLWAIPWTSLAAIRLQGIGRPTARGGQPYCWRTARVTLPHISWRLQAFQAHTICLYWKCSLLWPANPFSEKTMTRQRLNGALVGDFNPHVGLVSRICLMETIIVVFLATWICTTYIR